MSTMGLIERQQDIPEQLIQEVSRTGRLHAKLQVPFNDIQQNSMKYIVALESDRKDLLAKKLTQYNNILSSLEDSEISIRDNINVTKRALQVLGLNCDQKFIDQLIESDLIEVYATDMTQIFRNFRFFEICGYSLLEVEAYPWNELYERSHLITEKLLRTAAEVISSRGGCRAVNMPPHYMKEKFSYTKQVVQVELKNAAPVYDDLGEPNGFIISQDVKIVLPTDYEGRIDFI